MASTKGSKTTKPKTAKASKTKKPAPAKAKEDVKKKEKKVTPVKKTVTKSPVAQKATAKVSPKKPVAPKAAPKKTAKKKAGYTPEDLLKEALTVLSDRQAQDVVEFDLRGRTAIADYAIVASGTSNRHLIAMADYIRRAFRDLGVKNIQIEGLERADWVLVDAGDVLVHLFRPEVRDYYQIEDIWSVSKPKKAK